MFAYIHIPFCSNKCKYCRFVSQKFDENKILTYFDFLENEIKNFGKIEALESVYFGGGTPTSVDFNFLQNILDLLEKKFGFEKNIEITIETTPQNITEKNILLWQKSKINRISVGLQSLNEETLNEIGREKKETIISALKLLEKSVFENISVDFILGLPFEGQGEKIKQFEEIFSLCKKIKHISVYMLEDYVYPENWSKNSIKVENLGDEFSKIVAFLSKNGFGHYELSNFAKKGFECKHNLCYWNHKNYVGFGVSAHSFINGARFANSNSFEKYYEKKLDYKEILTEKDLILEKIMFQIRTNGIEKKLWEFLEKENVDNFIKNGYLKKKERLCLTDKAFCLCDYILAEICK